MPRVRELIVQYRAHPSGAMIDGRSLIDPNIAASIAVPLLEDQPQEVFIALHLNVRRHLIGVQEITRGGLSSCQPAIRTILTACLGEKNTDALILAHNHPSGDPTPSADDLEITLKIQTACRIFDIQVLDHLIIGQGQFISLQRTGRMRYL